MQYQWQCNINGNINGNINDNINGNVNGNVNIKNQYGSKHN